MKRPVLPLVGAFLLIFIVGTSSSFGQSPINAPLAYPSDAKAVTVISPPQDTTYAAGTIFPLSASFVNVGSKNLLAVPAKVEIRSCANNTLVFKADTVLPPLYLDSPAVIASFPTKKDDFDLKNLPDGCYKVTFASQQSDDANHTNDALYHYFSIGNLGKNDVKVSYINPGSGITFDIDSPIAPGATFQNFGINDQHEAKTMMQVKDSRGHVVYSDSSTIDLLSQELEAVKYRSFSLPYGRYSMSASIWVPGDDHLSDDTITVTITVGLINDIKVAAIISPSKGQTLPSAEAVTAKVSVALAGPIDAEDSITVYADLGAADKSVVVSRTKTFRIDSMASSSTLTFEFDTILPDGYYRLDALAYFPLDARSDNNEMTTSFSIGLSYEQHNITPVSTDLPLDKGSLWADRSNRLGVRLYNAGSSVETNVPVIARIRSTIYNTITYEDSLNFSSINPFEFQDGVFRPLQLFLPDSLELTIFSGLGSDQRSSDDTLRLTFPVRFVSDIALKKFTVPKSNSLITKGTPIIPTCIFSGTKNDFPRARFPVTFTLFDSVGHFLNSGSDTCPQIILDGNDDTIAFAKAFKKDILSTLPLGRYTLKVFPTTAIDNNITNDMATTTFTIVEDAGVPLIIKPGVLSISPNPCTDEATIRYTIEETYTVSERILDIAGRTVMSFPSRQHTAGSYEEVLPLTALPAGSYILEQQLHSANKPLRRQTFQFIKY